MIRFYLCLPAMMLLPVGGSVLFYLFINRADLKTLSRKRKAIAAGLFFGILAILQSETAILVNLPDNRNMAFSSPNIVPICAGLFFDGTAGLLSAMIESVYCFISFSRTTADPVLLSETLSTLAAGVTVFFIRRYLLGDKKTSAGFCCCTALAASAMSVLLYPLSATMVPSRLTDIYGNAVVPLFLSNTLSVYFPFIIIRRLETGRFFPPRTEISVHERRYSRIAAVSLILLGTVTGLISGFSNAALSRQMIDSSMRADVADIITVLEAQPAVTLSEISEHFHVYDSGYCIIADQEGTVLAEAGIVPETPVTLQKIGIDLKAAATEGVPDTATINGVRSLWVHKSSGKYIVVGVVSEDEVYSYLPLQSMLTLSTEVLLLYFLALVINILLKLQTACSVKEMHDKFGKVIGPEKFTTETGVFSFLDHSATEYMNGIVTRISDEMKFAGDIQMQALPMSGSESDGLSIHSVIRPARQIGGDFYDYFPIDTGRTAVLIADVSGKGISAAMFMMRAKAAIRGAASEDSTPENLLRKVNETLCEGNDDNMFVTLWLGIIEHETGRVHYINAGQGTQLMRHPGEDYEPIPGEPGIPLGLRNGWTHEVKTLRLRPGSRLFLSTDGVTEANDPQGQLFGEERLRQTLNENCIAVTGTLTMESVLEQLTLFADGREQSDDITMLCVDYFGRKVPAAGSFSVLTLPAEDENLDRAWGFVEKILEPAGCSPTLLMNINVAFEEIFVNICHYAYPGTGGSVTLEVSLEENLLKIRFSDNGIPFNPLHRKKQRSSVPLHERKEGGLGITLVKELMDYVEYECADGRNILTMTKVLH